MIANFKNTKAGIESCDFIDILSDYNLWTDLFVTNPDFFFASESEITDQQEWSNNIILQNITPLYHIKEIEPNNEDPVRYTGIQDIEVEIYKGKYKYDFYFNYDIALYNKVNKLHNKPAYIYLFDKNDNIYGSLNGTDIYGIRCELFTVSKLILGETQNPSGFKVSIVIDGNEGDNIRVYEKDFNSLDLIYTEEGGSGGLTYSITNVTSASPLVMQITIQDSNSDPVESLSSSAFSIVDSLNGSLVIEVFNESSPGVYDLTLDKVVSSGSVYVNVPPVISYTYSLRSLSTIYNIQFGNNWADITFGGFDQKEYPSWESQGTFANDYEIDETGASNYDLKIVVFAGAGNAGPYYMRTINSAIFEAGKDYIAVVSLKPNYTTTGANDRLQLVHENTTPGEYITLTNSASFYKSVLEFSHTANSSNSNLSFYIGSFPRQGADVEIEIESVTIYEVLT